MPLVRSVIIVGAGSAGWLTALVLRTYCPYLRVSLVRPRKLPTIGVGESTQADFLRVLFDSRIGVEDFYTACDATMKCGIFYEDWNGDGTNERELLRYSRAALLRRDDFAVLRLFSIEQTIPAGSVREPAGPGAPPGDKEEQRT